MTSIRVSCQPELLPEVVLELRRSGTEASVALATRNAGPPHEPIEADGVVQLEDVPVSIEPPVDPFAGVDVPPAGGRGGVHYEVEAQAEGRRHRFVDRGDGPVAGELARWLYLLARHSLQQPAAQRGLDQLYRGGGTASPPWAELSGPPRTVRIFGSITAGNAESFAALLGAIPSDTATLVEVAPAAAIDVAAFGAFRTFDARMERVAYLLPARLLPERFVLDGLSQLSSGEKRVSARQKRRVVQDIERRSVAHQLRRDRIFADPAEVAL